MSMSMATSTLSSTMAAASATSTASSSHSGMSMGDTGDASTCIVSMLWNWNTIDACFLSSSWHITSNGMFAASCIGVFLLVVVLEFMRRVTNEYDKFILREFQRNVVSKTIEIKSIDRTAMDIPLPESVTFRASPLQQSIRAVLHAVTFGVAYIIMLLAMYYNGYFIICIFLGAGFGKFLCDWMVVQIPLTGAAVERRGNLAGDEPSVCCG